MTKEIYIFTKSGAKVVIIGREFKLKSNSKLNGIPCFSVKRVDSGKRMTVPKSALIKENMMQE